MRLQEYAGTLAVALAASTDNSIQIYTMHQYRVVYIPTGQNYGVANLALGRTAVAGVDYPIMAGLPEYLSFGSTQNGNTNTVVLHAIAAVAGTLYLTPIIGG